MGNALKDPRIPEGFKRAMKGEAVPLPIDQGTLRFPLLGSTKIDGVRGTMFGGCLFSYNLKPFRNRRLSLSFLTKKLADSGILQGVDGELTVGPANAPDVCKRTTAALNSADSPEVENVVWNVFDVWSPDRYDERAKRLRAAVKAAKAAQEGLRIKILRQKVLHNMDELEAFENEVLDDGWEGVMLRDPRGFYKMGRSTILDGALVKLKRFEDMEARVVGAYTMQHNGNAAERDATGKLKRSSCKAGKTDLGVLGGFEMEGLAGGPFPGVRFHVGGGFSADERKDYWSRRSELIGKVGTIKFLAHGSDQRPRHPTWKLFRLSGDI